MLTYYAKETYFVSTLLLILRFDISSNAMKEYACGMLNLDEKQLIRKNAVLHVFRNAPHISKHLFFSTERHSLGVAICWENGSGDGCLLDIHMAARK